MNNAIYSSFLKRWKRPIAGNQIELRPDIMCSLLAISAFPSWCGPHSLSLRRPTWAVNLWVTVKCSDSEYVSLEIWISTLQTANYLTFDLIEDLVFSTKNTLCLKDRFVNMMPSHKCLRVLVAPLHPTLFVTPWPVCSHTWLLFVYEFLQWYWSPGDFLDLAWDWPGIKLE